MGAGVNRGSGLTVPADCVLCATLARRIGICRALHAYHHYALWKTFLEELGWEVTLSPTTNRDAIEQGVRLSPSELCLPVKAFLGHAAMMKDKVDAILLPRIVCSKVGHDLYFGCPKALALPDLARAVFDSLPVVVEPVLDHRIQSDEKAWCDAVSQVNSQADAGRAFRIASAAARAATERTRLEGSPLHMFGQAPNRRAFPESAVRVGVVGHSYLLYDSGLSLDVLDKVREAGGLPVVAFPTDTEFEREMQQETALNWYYELELLAAARRLLEQEKVDGLLLVASFACGTGAVTNEIIHRSAVHRHRVPTIQLLLDEHTGEAGLVTRIESFVDVLRMRKK
jgi:predicted nucleotide-binding protein (sugar kinase/HSP70/actin superfamily)